MRELHLFAGAGGGLLASVMLGHRPVCAVEIDPYCRAVLQARRDEGWLPAEMEIHDDVTTFNGHAWRGRIDLVAGGFPCQDISVAGKGAGLDGARSGLFFQLLRVVREVRPKWVYLENVPAITSRGLDRVLGALAELGFDAEWCVLSAADAGAPHLRKRWWCLARYTDGHGAMSTESGVRQGSAADASRGGEADVADTDAGQRDGAEPALRAGRDTADDGRADVPDAAGWRCAPDQQPGSGGSPTGRGEADAVAGGGDVPDTARRQDDGRGRGELACEAGAWRCGDAAAFAGGEDDPDAEGRGLAELRSASREAGHADGLRKADAADAGHCFAQECAGDDDIGSGERQRPKIGWRSKQRAGLGTMGRDASRIGAERVAASPAGALVENVPTSQPDAADAHDAGRDAQRLAVAAPAQHDPAECSRGRATQCRLGRAPDGLAEWLDASSRGYWAGDWETQPRLAQGQPNRVARLRALGNGQVPQTAAMAFRILMQRYQQRGEA